MDTTDRLNLSKLIKEYNSEETTDQIRELKHSTLIRDDVTTIQKLKGQYARMYKSNREQFKTIAQSRANFLFNNYTNIFNRVVNDELNLKILWNFLEILGKIEEGEIDQHECSFMVGNLLKQMYIDSALQKDAKLAENEKRRRKVEKKPTVNISWAQYKMMNEEE